jgi:trigger factor
MNITKENIDALNAVVKVKIGPEDYQGRVEKTLKNYQKQVTMPGFRTGKVPASLVKKMYGKSVLADELNKLLSDELHNYIQSNNIDVLGNPLPRPQNDAVDIENQTEFEFQFDMALSPQFELTLNSNMQYTEYTVKIDDNLIDKHIEDLTRRYGSVTNAETINAADLVVGDFVELDSNGEILPGGIFKTSSLFLENPIPERYSALENKGIGDKVIFAASQIDDTPAAIAQRLGLEPHAVEGLTSNFLFTVKTITHLMPAELNQDLFDKIYGTGNVQSIDDFRSRVAVEIGQMLNDDKERRLRNQIADDLIARTNLSLPDAFLKRWLLTANEKPITQQQIDNEYDTYAKQLRWQLIENKLIKDNAIEVTTEEAIDHVKKMMRDNYKKYGINPDDESDETYTKNAKDMLSKEVQARGIFQAVYQEKLMVLYRMKCTIQSKEQTYDEFIGASAQ